MDVRLSAFDLRTTVAPPAVRWIVRTLEDAGYESWAVGGAVRDVLLGIDSDDWDLATRARPEQLRRLFRRTVPVGIEHGTVGVLARDGTLYEVTTFRRDVVTDGRHAVVEFSDRLEDDLSRRDFTINAIAWHPLRGELFDPYGGAADLVAGVLRTVGDPAERFAEDYLRVLRALRFAGRFTLSIEPPTWRALVSATRHLDVLSRERVREELMKVLAGDPHPTRALGLYRSSGVLQRVAPELEPSEKRAPPDPLLPALDAWPYGLALAEAVRPHRPLLRLAALLHAAGVGRPPADAASSAAQLMIRLRFSNAQVDQVVRRVAAAALPQPGGGDASLRRWLSRVGPEPLRDIFRLWVARERVRAQHGAGDPGAFRSLWTALRAELRRRPPLSVGDLALDGGDLIRMGMKPGPGFRIVLETLLDRVLEDPSLNERERLEALVREMPRGNAGASPEGGG